MLFYAMLVWQISKKCGKSHSDFRTIWGYLGENGILICILAIQAVCKLQIMLSAFCQIIEIVLYSTKYCMRFAGTLSPFCR